MSPSEKIRAMLDERGIEYTANDGEHVKETCWPYMGELMTAFAEYDNGTTRFACDTWCFTPEQAIAATVGARYSTIDMDWVRDLVERHSDHIDGNTCTFHNGAYARMAEEIAATVGNAMTLDEAIEYAEGFMGTYAKVLLASTLYVERDEPTDQHLFDVAVRKEAQMVRTLAEALATAGVGTCTIVKTWTDSDYADHWRYSCSECGYQIEVGERDIATGNPTSHANFCWNCGRRCIGIKEVTE